MLALAAWSGWFIFRTSFPAAGGERVFCLADDAMITMTYARNLWDGYGLNWARFGRPVEGFTHPLWLAVMVGINAFRLPLAQRSLGIQLISAALLLVELWAVRRLWMRLSRIRDAVSSLPVLIVTASYYPLNYWALMGMETAAAALLITLVAAELLDAVSGEEPRVVRWIVFGCLALLLRADMLVALLPPLGVLLLRRRRREALGLTIGLLAGVVPYQIFRLAYFGDALPNTYYLKLVGVPLLVRVLRGIDVLLGFARHHLALLAVFALWPLAAQSRRRLLCICPLVAATFAYAVYIGGDVWDYSIPEVFADRFIAPVMPVVFAMAAAILWEVAAGLSSASRPPLGRFAATAAALMVAASINGLLPADMDQWRIWTGVTRPPQVDGNRLVFSDWQRLRRIAPPGAIVATFWAGIPAFFGDFRMIDILGFSDRRTAHLPPAVALSEDNFRDFTPGHVKWDNQYLIDVARPDAFFRTWAIPDQLIGPLMRRHGYEQVEGFWLRTR